MQNRVIPISHVKKMLNTYGVHFKTDTEAKTIYENLSCVVEEHAETITATMEVLSNILYSSTLSALTDPEWESIHHTAIRLFVDINYHTNFN